MSLGDLHGIVKTIENLASRVRALETRAVGGGGGAHTHDASAVTFTPNDNTDWTGSADPGNTDDGLDQLADRVSTLEGGVGHAAATLGPGSDPALALVGQQFTLADVLTPAEHTAIGSASPHHAAITLNAAADTVLGLSTQQVTLDSQDANKVFAGPTSGAAAAPSFRTTVVADLPADAMLWSIIQASQFVNEIKNWPPYVAMDVDLVAGNLWWDSLGTPTTAATMVDVAGEAGVTEIFEYCLKVVADAGNEGLYQRWTYADEPRVKSGRVMSTLWAIWCVGGVGATLSLTNSDASETAAAKVTAAAWTIVKVENHTLAGTYCDVKVTLDGAGTVYAVPLGASIASKAVPLGPRPSIYVDISQVRLVNSVDPGGAGWTDVDCTASTSNLAYMADLYLYYSSNQSNSTISLRRNGSSDSPYWMLISSNSFEQTSLIQALDDSQIFEYDTNQAAAAAETVIIYINGYWEWA